MSASRDRTPPGAEDIRYLSIDEAFEFAEAQVRALITRVPGQMPTYTEGGRWVFDQDPWAPTWTGGFLTGKHRRETGPTPGTRSTCGRMFSWRPMLR